MPVVEYKHHISHMGKIEVPGWVMDRGYHYRDSDKTYLGWVEDSADREYLIPNDVVHLTKAEAVTRHLAIHAANPFRWDSDGAGNVLEVGEETSGAIMSTKAVTDQIENWYDQIKTNNGE